MMGKVQADDAAGRGYQVTNWKHASLHDLLSWGMFVDLQDDRGPNHYDWLQAIISAAHHMDVR